MACVEGTLVELAALSTLLEGSCAIDGKDVVNMQAATQQLAAMQLDKGEDVGRAPA